MPSASPSMLTLNILVLDRFQFVNTMGLTIELSGTVSLGELILPLLVKEYSSVLKFSENRKCCLKTTCHHVFNMASSSLRKMLYLIFQPHRCERTHDQCTVKYNEI